jgi:hypothetical protein
MNEYMAVEKVNWYTLEELAIHWGTNILKILDLSQRDGLKIYFNWVELKSKFGDAVEIFTDNNQDSYEDYVIRKIVFKELNNDYDYQKYIPYNHPLHELAVLQHHDVGGFRNRSEVKLQDIEGYDYIGDYILYIASHDNTQITLKITDLVVTTDEINRFSHLNRKHIKSNTSSNNVSEVNLNVSTYITPWLTLLERAKIEHFPDNRNIDPKKDVVTDWILQEAYKLGINPSEHIANAIFTIIKPENHNPKKKRG